MLYQNGTVKNKDFGHQVSCSNSECFVVDPGSIHLSALFSKSVTAMVLKRAACVFSVGSDLSWVAKSLRKVERHLRSAAAL